jgi:hypothetical protein
MPMPSFLRVALAVSVALIGGCSQSSAPRPSAVTPAESAVWTRFVDDFVEGYFKAQPMFAVQSGRHEFDGQMPDWSRAGIEAEVARLQTARSGLLAIDLSGMSSAQKFEREYLLWVIDNDLFWDQKAADPFRNPAWYVNQLDPEVYLSRAYAPLEQRLPGYIGYAKAIPGITANIRANLRTPMPKPFVEYAVKAFGGFAAFYASDVPKVFASITDPAKQKELREANAAATRAMKEITAWFVAQRKTANDQFALGPALYADMLRDTDGLNLPLPQVKAAVEADAARNTAALKDACAEFAPGKSVVQCFARVHARKSPKGVVEGARGQLAELRAFIQEKGFVTIPGEEQAEVAEAPPYNRSNTAYIIIPGFYEKNVPSVYNLSPPDPTWSKAEQLDYIDGEDELLNRSVHEVWPGHFLQYLHANRSKSIIGRLWVGYAYAEGWAHYSEELMVDMGLRNGDQEMHIAQLKDALWRDARMLSSIGLHTEGMTVAQSEKLFRDLSYDNPGSARQQAARGTNDPAYLNYTLGKLMIRKLRDDWVAKQMAGKSGEDPKSYWRAFHDQLLSYGGPPLPLVRRAMLPGDSGALL